ncbi:MAG: hypothetical protein IKK75_12595 [Clostridia bacterium]|nr:hypothetical protein [Clostridia bacterium]
MLTAVLDALKELRSPFALYETDIHQMVAARLSEAGLLFVHEARLGPGCRIDYLVDTIGIEIKKGKPDATAVKRQLIRYAACEGVSAIILLTQRAVNAPKTVMGKPVHVIVLNHLWGVALP